MISDGHPAPFVAAQLGHASPAVTLEVYARLFDGARHADSYRAAMEERYGAIAEAAVERSVERSDGNGRELPAAAPVADLALRRG